MADPKPMAALLSSAFIWGVAPVFIRSLSVELGPADSMIIRYVLVSSVCAVLLLVNGGWRIARADWPRLLLISLVGLFGYSAGSVYGFAFVPAGIGGLIYATQPLFIAVLAAFLLSEKLTVYIWLGLVLAFAGTVLLFWNDLSAGASAQSYLAGILLLLMASFVWAVYTVPGRVLFQRYGAFNITATSMILATVPMLALASPGTLDTLASMTRRNWFDLLFLSLFSTFLAMITWNYAAAKLRASVTGAALYLIPLIAVVAGAVILGETVTAQTVFGGLLILGGVAVAQFGPRLGRTGHEQNAV